MALVPLMDLGAPAAKDHLVEWLEMCLRAG
jgi:hypothetical protein